MEIGDPPGLAGSPISKRRVPPRIGGVADFKRRVPPPDWRGRHLFYGYEKLSANFGAKSGCDFGAVRADTLVKLQHFSVRRKV